MSESIELFGLRCRTMLTQRPCGTRGCVRPECNARIEPVKAPTTGAQLALVPVPTYTLTGLTAAHIERLQDALSQVSTSDPIGMELQAILYKEHRS